MFTFDISDMTCGHCVRAISKAVASIDEGAKVQCDVATHRIQVDPTHATIERIADAIKAAGYTPVIVDGLPAAPATKKRSGCCCG